MNGVDDDSMLHNRLCELMKTYLSIIRMDIVQSASTPLCRISHHIQNLTVFAAWYGRSITREVAATQACESSYFVWIGRLY